jgi:hypothetical protein
VYRAVAVSVLVWNRPDGMVEQARHHLAVRVCSPPPGPFGLGEDLLGGAVHEPGGVDAVLVDRDHAAVLQQGEVGAVQVGQVGAQDERRRGQRPQAQLGLPLGVGQAVVAAVAHFDRVVVVERARAAVGLPGGDLLVLMAQRPY